MEVRDIIIGVAIAFMAIGMSFHFALNSRLIPNPASCCNHFNGGMACTNISRACVMQTGPGNSCTRIVEEILTGKSLFVSTPESSLDSIRINHPILNSIINSDKNEKD